MSLASINEFIQVFQATVSVLHSLHHLCGIAIAILATIGCDFVGACAGYSLSMSNRPYTCDSLHVSYIICFGCCFYSCHTLFGVLTT